MQVVKGTPLRTLLKDPYILITAGMLNNKSRRCRDVKTIYYHTDMFKGTLLPCVLQLLLKQTLWPQPKKVFSLVIFANDMSGDEVISKENLTVPYFWFRKERAK